MRLDDDDAMIILLDSIFYFTIYRHLYIIHTYSEWKSELTTLFVVVFVCVYFWRRMNAAVSVCVRAYVWVLPMCPYYDIRHIENGYTCHEVRESVDMHTCVRESYTVPTRSECNRIFFFFFRQCVYVSLLCALSMSLGLFKHIRPFCVCTNDGCIEMVSETGRRAHWRIKIRQKQNVFFFFFLCGNECVVSRLCCVSMYWCGIVVFFMVLLFATPKIVRIANTEGKNTRMCECDAVNKHCECRNHGIRHRQCRQKSFKIYFMSLVSGFACYRLRLLNSGRFRINLTFPTVFSFRCKVDRSCRRWSDILRSVCSCAPCTHSNE